MSVNRTYINEWFEEHVKGRQFRSPRGTTVWTAEALWIDDSLEQHYNFVHVYVRLRSAKGRTKLVSEYDLKHKWIETRPIFAP